MIRITTALLAFALLVGCTSQASHEAPEYVNANCPMMGNPVEEDGGSTEWNGQTIGFCCDGCGDKFDALDDAGKQAALDKHNK